MVEHCILARFVAIIAVMMTAASSSFAQDSAGADLRLTHPGGPDGIGHYVPGKWGAIRFRIANPADRGAEGLVVSFFGNEPEQQFGRRLWVPPRASRESWLPILAPRVSRENVKQAEIKSFLVETAGPTEVLLKHGETEKVYSAPVVLERRPIAVVTITDVDSPRQDDTEIWLEALEAAQIARFGSAQLLELPRDFLPVLPETLAGMNGLVVLGNRLVHDPAGMLAILEWVNAGGTLWIMLDLVDPVTVQLLLGDAFQSLIVDRVGLNEVAIKKSTGGTVNLPLREFEEPIEMVRVEPDGAEVIHTANDWPISFQQKIGHGRVVFTTLGVRAWVTPRNVTNQKATSAPHAKYELSEPIKEVFDVFFEPVERTVPAPETLGAIVANQIGYEILERTHVFSVLGSFCTGLLVAGLWLKRRERLEQMAWVLPLAALLASLPLAVAAEFRRQSVAPTVAVAQMMEVERDRNVATVTGLAAMYEPQPWTAPLAANRNGILFPDRADAGGTIRRMVWTDSDSAHWENLKFPAGVSLAKFSFPQPLEKPLQARLRFGLETLTGSIPKGLLTEMADGVIATSSDRAIGLHIAADGTFGAGSGDVLAPHQYVAGAILSDEQRRRQDVFTHVFEETGRVTKYPASPMLFVWSRPLEMPFTLPREMQQIGSMLTVLPVDIERPEPGARFHIPSPFLSCQAVPGPNSLGASVSFDNRGRQWQEQSRATETWIRFQMPTEVIPAKLEQATLTLDIAAPLRTVELSAGATSQMVSIERRRDMVGRFTYRIDAAEALQLDQQGGLHVLLNFGEIAVDSANGLDAGFLEKRWKVNALDLEVQARSLPRSGGPTR